MTDSIVFPSSSEAWPLPFTSPESVGLCSTRLDRIGAMVDRLIAEQTIAGAITLMARRGQIAHLRCAGMQDVAAGRPMAEDAIFRLYSMTKPIVCVATLMLYETGALSLQDPVSRFLPEFADLKVAVATEDGSEQLVSPRRPVNIHDLLTHTGGLTYALAQDADREGMDLKGFITAFSKIPLACHPGERWIYSASNEVLGRVIEVVSGVSLQDFLLTKIFTPLQMNDTGFFVSPEEFARLAAIYEHDDDARIVPKEFEDYPYIRPPTMISGGGGLVGSTPDYLRFALMLLRGGALEGRRLLSPKSVELMRQDHLPPGHPAIEPYKFGYGYGVSVVRSLREKQGIASVGEFGWGGAACTNTWIDPSEDLISMVMIQLKGSKVPMIDHRIKVLMTQAIVE